VQPDIRGLAQEQGLFETIMRAHEARLMRSHSIQHWVLDDQRPAWRLTRARSVAFGRLVCNGLAFQL
jgi:hypothetical protein